MPTRSSILCEIIAPGSVHAQALAKVVLGCAKELGQTIKLKQLKLGSHRARDVDPSLTLHLPAQLASTQNVIWCLACRLACSYPAARISVLIHGAEAFAADDSATSSINYRPARLSA